MFGFWIVISLELSEEELVKLPQVTSGWKLGFEGYMHINNIEYSAADQTVPSFSLYSWNVIGIG